MRKLSRSSKVIVALTLAVAMLSVAFAATLYTMTVTNTMRLAVSYGLVLETDAHAPITAVDWDGFTHLQSKSMKDVIGCDVVQLVNTGNSAVDVSWNSTLPSGWTLGIVRTFDDAVWVSGEPFTVPVGGVVTLRITLNEVSAVAGDDYGFNLNFNVVD